MEQAEKRKYLIKTLLAEQPKYAALVRLRKIIKR